MPEEAVKIYNDDYSLTRWGRIVEFADKWGPWYSHCRPRRWMTVRSYLRLLWARATEPLNHEMPVRPKNDTLIVPIEYYIPQGVSIDWANAQSDPRRPGS